MYLYNCAIESDIAPENYQSILRDLLFNLWI